MGNIAFAAMLFAREAHKHQVRKYTGNPYADHLAEVAGIVGAAGVFTCDLDYTATREQAIAVAWLHDCVEDCAVEIATISAKFGPVIAQGVELLSDMETGNRPERKEASRKRLAGAPGWVQSIKCADLASNTSSIVKHDPKFAVTYLEEKRLLLGVMTKADPRLIDLAKTQVINARCWCKKCQPITIHDMRMVVCPVCGNKRCPKASDHELPCSNSNVPGQAGTN